MESNLVSLALLPAQALRRCWSETLSIGLVEMVHVTRVLKAPSQLGLLHKPNDKGFFLFFILSGCRTEAHAGQSDMILFKAVVEMPVLTPSPLD